ncbi:assimilatory nitrate reductase large subunit [Geminocystis sp. NIES-3708]|uniref:molybdopterin oxidoreductase family protein n=1 Tax=Geminocystis sp. NIES-3708 TaxID=1615909 RepID=UPI0005FC4DC6|nr:nitrate reductase [Geminocystis sp. NIES-3708]BAQ60749.1 assimilatory nitrate reductase large subunit [Geminocystis sp. NIES-3708]
MSKKITTVCPYCGVGCGLEVQPPSSGKTTNGDSLGNPIWKVMGDRNHPSSLGKVCVKGATVTEAMHKNRLEYPLYRETLEQEFHQITWEEAYNLIVNRINTVRETMGVDGICIYGSGQFQTEDYYIAQKLIKGCLGTNNFDANSRLCMSSAVSGYIGSFGADGPPCIYEDLELTDCAFLVGTNTAECHPIVFNRLRAYHKKNDHVKIIVVDPRGTATADVADLHLAINLGTDIDLFNGIAYLLLQRNALDYDFIEQHTNYFNDFKDVILQYPPELVAKKCGITVEDLKTCANYWAESKKVLSLFSMGLNQSSEGTAKVRGLINLHLMTGKMGVEGSGAFSLTGQPNAMGGREAGGLAQLLPGYRSVLNPYHRAEIEGFWSLPQGSVDDRVGKTVWEMITGLETEEVGIFWVAATNPVVSMPDLERTKKALLKSPFTVYQDAYYPTETAYYAHLVLPAAQWSEKAGTMTNSERVVTYCPQFSKPPGEAKADWEIFAEVGRRLGFEKYFNFTDSSQVYQEFSRLTANRPCDVSGITHELLLEYGAIQWPFPHGSNPENRYGRRLYTDFKFYTDNNKANFSAYHSQGLAEPPNPDYPFVLTIGRLYGHWHTMTRTGRIDKIVKMHPEPFLEIHPKDAHQLNLEDDDFVTVTSLRGEAKFKVKVTKAIAPKTVFVPMHWGFLWADNAEANSLTHPQACPISKQPELKACAVKLTKFYDI